MRLRIAVVLKTGEVYAVAVRWMPTAPAAILCTATDPVGPVIVLGTFGSVRNRRDPLGRWIAALRLKRELARRAESGMLRDLATDSLLAAMGDFEYSNY